MTVPPADATFDSGRDPLTGTLSRHAIHREVQRSFAAYFDMTEGQRSPPELPTPWLAIVDLHRFRDFNNYFGFGVGDVALRRVGAALSAVLEPGECIGRTAGDRFTVLGRHGDLPAVRTRAEALRDAVRSVRLDGINTAGHGADDLPVTTLDATIGATRFDPKDRAIQHVLSRADYGLSCVKSTGRERVFVQQTHVGGRTPYLLWMSNRGKPAPMHPETPFGHNFAANWLRVGEARRVRLPSPTADRGALVLEVTEHVYADARAWAARILLGETPLALSEERIDIVVDNRGSDQRRVDSSNPPLIDVTLLFDQMLATKSAPPPRVGDGTWTYATEQALSGAVYNSILYQRQTQTLTIDVARRTACMRTVQWADLSS